MSASEFTSYTPLPNDWTVVEETIMNEQFSEREVVRLHPPTSTISTTADNNMSYSFFSDREVEVKRESRTGSEVEVNDQQFQIDTLQDSVDDLKNRMMS